MIASSQASNVKSTYRPRRAPPSAHKSHLPNYPTRLNSIASETGSIGTNEENRLIKLNSLNSNDIHPNENLAVDHDGDSKCFLRNMKNRFVEAIKNISAKKDEENELEDPQASVARYKPRPIEELVKATRFSRKEIQHMYRGFKQECPSGIVNEQMFKEIYAQFFPQGECGNYAHFVFSTMDSNSSGIINFEDFLMGLSILSRGTMDEKLRWIFNLYDLNGDGKVTKEELTLVVSSVFDLMGKCTNPIIDDSLPKKTAECVFNRFNPKQDGALTIEDFLQTCYNDETILNSISMLDNVL